MVFPSICWRSELSKHEVFGENRDGGGFVSVKCKQTSQVKSQADMPGRVPDAKGSPVLFVLGAVQGLPHWRSQALDLSPCLSRHFVPTVLAVGSWWSDGSRIPSALSLS